MKIEELAAFVSQLTEPQTRSMNFVASTYDPVNHTVEVDFASENPVIFSTAKGDFEEVLGLRDGECDLTRLMNGAPVFYAHGFKFDPAKPASTAQFANKLERPQVGVVEKGWIAKEPDGLRGRALIRFSQRDEVIKSGIEKDVADGILRGVSAGYNPKEIQYEDVTPPGARIPRLRAKRWAPHEITLVPVQADITNQVRAQGVAIDPPEKLLGSAPASGNAMVAAATVRAGDGRSAMTPEELAAAEAKQKAEAKAAEEARTRAADLEKSNKAAELAIADRSAKEERGRAKKIRDEVAAVGLETKVAEELVESGASIEGARSKIIELVAERTKTAGVRSAVHVGLEPRDHIKKGIQEAIEYRVGLLPKDKLTPEFARKYVGRRMLELAEISLVGQLGHELESHNPNDVAAMALGLRAVGALGTSDFANLSGAVVNKQLGKAYDIAMPTYRQVARKMNASDFKPMKVVNLGIGSMPVALGETAEVPYSSLTDNGETLTVGTFGKLIAFTRKMLINDDTGALDRLPSFAGKNAAVRENTDAWALLIANPTMLTDSVAVINSAHGNTLGAAPNDLQLGEAGLGALRNLMRQQKDPDGNLLELEPRTLVVPSAKETIGQRLVSPIAPVTSGGVNPFAGKFQLLVVPQLDATSTSAYYLMAGTDQVDIFGYSYLNGSEAPRFEQFVKPELDGVIFRLLHDWGVSILDFRGITYSAGTT